MAFQEKIVLLNRADTDIFLCPENHYGSAGLVFINMGPLTRTIGLKFYSQLTRKTVTIFTEQPITAYDQLVWRKPFGVIDGDRIIASCSVNESVNVIISISLNVAGDGAGSGIGPTGPQGDKGDKGDQGIQGIHGIAGVDGNIGLQGNTGFQGIQGIQGIQGEIGIQGIKGDTGLMGSTGLTGAKGDTGLGIQGVQGAQGIQGIKGDIGSQGIQGNIGPIGITGLQGIKGDTGAIGAFGTTGLQGTQGEKGDTGLQGIQGVKGDTGASGGLDTVNTFVKNQRVLPVEIVFGSSMIVNASLSNNFKLTLTGNGVLENPTFLTEGMVLNFAITQDALGWRLLSYGNIFKFPNNISPTLSTSSGAKDFMSCYFDGSILMCTVNTGFTEILQQYLDFSNVVNSQYIDLIT